MGGGLKVTFGGFGKGGFGKGGFGKPFGKFGKFNKCPFHKCHKHRWW
jgi:hypothetical protein